VRAIDRETRRLDSIERSDPRAPSTASIPPSATAPPSATPGIIPSDQPISEVPLPGRDPRRLPGKSKVTVPRPPGSPSISNSPAVTQQLTPLPPPIEVRPAPGAVRSPKPRPPLVLTPPLANPPPSAF
jgi:large subunit ribosomal protein L24